jgi:hypothetical protein
MCELRRLLEVDWCALYRSRRPPAAHRKLGRSRLLVKVPVVAAAEAEVENGEAEAPARRCH